MCYCREHQLWLSKMTSLEYMNSMKSLFAPWQCHVLHRWLVTVFGIHGMFEGDIFLLRYDGNMVNIDMICWIFAPLVGQKKRLPQQWSICGLYICTISGPKGNMVNIDMIYILVFEVIWKDAYFSWILIHMTEFCNLYAEHGNPWLMELF